jgi:subtilase family serine protease
MQVKAWLEQQGFTVDSIARSGRWIEFSGTAQQVENSFQTSIHRYLVGGSSHVANSSDISIPSALAPVVRGVASLNDFFKAGRPPQQLTPQSRSLVANSPLPLVSLKNAVGEYNALGPGDFATIYNVGPLYDNNENGNGLTISIVADSNIRVSDVETFRKIFSLPANNPSIILNGTDPGVIYTASNNAAQEATFDVEWAGAIAPNAAIDLVVSADTATTSGVDLSAAYIVDNNIGAILSESFESCENYAGSQNEFYDSSLVAAHHFRSVALGLCKQNRRMRQNHSGQSVPIGTMAWPEIAHQLSAVLLQT